MRVLIGMTMRNPAKVVVVSIFVLMSAGVILFTGSISKIDPVVAHAQTAPQATPPASNAATNSNAAKPAAGDKAIPKEFTLGKDSLSEYGTVDFNHENHAVKTYSPDGKSVVSCAECHHTDQPKSTLKPPLVTSTRDVALTLASWKSSAQKVNECRSCHFQTDSVPDGKTIPTASYSDAGKTTTKELNNELAYHINCNTCHDASAKVRPDLIKKAGFATTKDCTICHKPN